MRDWTGLPVEQRWLVRHAQSDGNVAGVVQGQRRRIGLSPLGRLQATRLAADLAAHPWAAPPLVVSSDLRRAVETARPVARGLGVRLHTDRGLRERNFGVLQGQAAGDVADETGVRDGRVVDPDYRPRRGESVRDLHDRVATTLDRLLDTSPHRPLVVVAHGGSIRVARAYFAGVPLSGMAWELVPNAVPEPLLPDSLLSEPSLADH
jgi:broad specificity phosphatase PhoE